MYRDELFGQVFFDHGLPVSVREIVVSGRTLLEKRLSRRALESEEARARFDAEVHLLRRLARTEASAFVPRVLAAGVDGAGPFMHQEPLGMPTLAERLAARASAGHTSGLPGAWIERATATLLRAIAAIHEAADEAGALEVIHGDPSPSNLALDDRAERAIILDFDLALTADSPPEDGSFRGTIAYAAPEVARGARPDARADLFGFAACMLHAARGAPLRAPTSLAVALVQAAEEPVLSDAEAAELRGRGPAHALLVRCVSFAAEERPASARAALALLVPDAAC